MPSRITSLLLEWMVGKKVSIGVALLRNEGVESLRVSGVLGPHRVEALQTASGERIGTSRRVGFPRRLVAKLLRQ
jgi:hypothetical protein